MEQTINRDHIHYLYECFTLVCCYYNGTSTNPILYKVRSQSGGLHSSSLWVFKCLEDVIFVITLLVCEEVLASFK